MGTCASQPQPAGTAIALKGRAGSAPAALQLAEEGGRQDISAAGATGALVLAQINPLLRQASSQSVGSGAAGHAEDTLYMVRTDAWHSFHVAGFQVEAQLGLAGACTLDVLLTGPPGVLLWLQSQAALEGGSQLNASCCTLRLRWEVLLRLPGVKTLALGPPPAPLSTTEAARVKAFAASAMQHQPSQQQQQSGAPEDLSQRARLLSSKGRKVFLPMLVAEMLVATGQLQRTGDDLYSARKNSWMMPDLHFVGLARPRASLPSGATFPDPSWAAGALSEPPHAASSQATHATLSMGTLPSASTTTATATTASSSTSQAPPPGAGAPPARAPSRQARREQQARAHQQQQPQLHAYVQQQQHAHQHHLITHTGTLSHADHHHHSHNSHPHAGHSFASGSSAPLLLPASGPPSAHLATRPGSGATAAGGGGGSAASSAAALPLHSGAAHALSSGPHSATLPVLPASAHHHYHHAGGYVASPAGVAVGVAPPLRHHGSVDAHALAAHAFTPSSSASQIPDAFAGHHLKHLSPPFDPPGGAGGATPGHAGGGWSTTPSAATPSSSAAPAPPGPTAEANNRGSSGGGAAVAAASSSSWGLLGRLMALPGSSLSCGGATATATASASRPLSAGGAAAGGPATALTRPTGGASSAARPAAPRSVVVSAEWAAAATAAAVAQGGGAEAARGGGEVGSLVGAALPTAAAAARRHQQQVLQAA